MSLFALSENFAFQISEFTRVFLWSPQPQPTATGTGQALCVDLHVTWQLWRIDGVNFGVAPSHGDFGIEIIRYDMFDQSSIERVVGLQQNLKGPPY